MNDKIPYRKTQTYRLKENKRASKHHRKFPWIRMLRNAKNRAKKQNVPFDICLQDIIDIWPTNNICPITNIEFEITKKTSNSIPTLDKILPDKGYVKGNIQVISHLANTCKNDMIDPDIFYRLEAYIKNITTTAAKLDNTMVVDITRYTES